MAVSQITIFFNQTEDKHRLKAISEELLALNSSSKVQNVIFLFNKATQNVDILYILYTDNFTNNSKTIENFSSRIFVNNNEFLNGTVSKAMSVTSNSIKSVSFTYLKFSEDINFLEISSGHGVDEISSLLYKYGGPDISHFLLKLFTLSPWKQILTFTVGKLHISYHKKYLEIILT